MKTIEGQRPSQMLDWKRPRSKALLKAWIFAGPFNPVIWVLLFVLDAGSNRADVLFPFLLSVTTLSAAVAAIGIAAFSRPAYLSVTAWCVGGAFLGASLFGFLGAGGLGDVAAKEAIAFVVLLLLFGAPVWLGAGIAAAVICCSLLLRRSTPAP